MEYQNAGLNLSQRTISFVVNNALSSTVAGNSQYTKVISEVSPTAERFDFNSDPTSSTASNAPGFIGVGPSRGYSQSVGYGFSDAVSNFTPFSATAVEAVGVSGTQISSTDAAMFEDGIVSPSGSPQEFTVTTQTGTSYDLRVYVGNPTSSLSNIQVTVYTGSITNLEQTQLMQVSGVSTTAGGLNAFAAIELDGLVAGGVTTAAGSEITVVIKSTSGYVYTEGMDFALHGSLPAIAHQDPAGGVAPAGSPPVPALTMSQLQPVVNQAIAVWAAAGITPAQVAALQSTHFVITNLESQGALALTGSNTVQIDSTADGYGWFVDSSVIDPTAFGITTTAYSVHAGVDSPAYNHMDLLTVVTHELGHILGLADVSATFLPNDLMDIDLPTGTRRLPTPTDVDAVFAGGFDTTTQTAPIGVPQAFTMATPLSSNEDDTFEVDPALAQAWAAWHSTMTSAGPGDPDGGSGTSDGATVEFGRNGYFSAMGQIGRWFQK